MRSLPQRIATAAVLAVGIAAGSASLAHANSEPYCTNVYLSNYNTCEGARHSVTNNQVFGSASVCAGARDASHNFYGSYVCGYGNTYHCYSGANLLYPQAHNSENFYQTISGTDGYGTAPCPA